MRTNDNDTALPRPLLSRDQVDDLIAACSRRGPSGTRNRALISVLAFGGLRISEALSLRPCDLKLSGPSRGDLTVRTLKQKGPGPAGIRTLRLGEGALAIVEAWVTSRQALLCSAKTTTPLFCTIQDSRASFGRIGEGQVRKKGSTAITAQQVHTLLKRLAAKADVPAEAVHPHAFRHFFAVSCERARVPIGTVQRLLGHANLNTTAVYLARFGLEGDLQAVAGVFE